MATAPPTVTFTSVAGVCTHLRNGARRLLRKVPELELAALPMSTEELDGCVRRLLRVHHPDRNQGNEAQRKTQAILAARRHITKILASV